MIFVVLDDEETEYGEAKGRKERSIKQNSFRRSKQTGLSI